VDLEKNSNQAITLARLSVAPPEIVYEELNAYSKNLRCESSLSFSNDELENTLYARNDPLINLGLALNACNTEIISSLYNDSRSNMGKNSAYWKGVSLACLSNSCPNWRLGLRPPISWLGEEEFNRLVVEGEDEEISLIFSNPGINAGILGNLYTRQAPFDSIPEKRWLRLISASAKNPRINIDDSNEFGPDLGSWDIHKGILALLETAPTTPECLKRLYFLLFNLDPDVVKYPDKDIAPILQRWSSVSIKGRIRHDETGLSGEDKDLEGEGFRTQCTFVEEFRCLIAALYGGVFAEKELRVMGNQSSEDIADRCSYYANTLLTPEQMKVGWGRDKEAFVFAALLNTQLYYKAKTRALLESFISGYQRYDYVRRCEQIAKKKDWFDPKPITEEGIDLLNDLIPATKPSDELKEIKRLAGLVEALERKFSNLRILATLGFFFLGIVFYMKR
jgi:hypothetical protein